MLTLAAKRTREECEEGGGLVDNRAALAKENGVKKGAFLDGDRKSSRCSDHGSTNN